MNVLEIVDIRKNYKEKYHCIVVNISRGVMLENEWLPGYAGFFKRNNVMI